MVLSGIKSVWGMPQVSDPGAVDGMAIQFLYVLVEPGLEVFAVLQQMADRAFPYYECLHDATQVIISRPGDFCEPAM